MKKVLTKGEVLSGMMCPDIEKTSFISCSEIKIMDILKSEIPLKNKRWFVFIRFTAN